MTCGATSISAMRVATVPPYVVQRNRRSHCAQRFIGGEKFAINRQDGENPYRHFGFGTQNETGLALQPPEKRGERTVVPVAHRTVLSLSKPLSLNGLRFSFSKSAKLRPRRNAADGAWVRLELMHCNKTAASRSLCRE